MGKTVRKRHKAENTFRFKTQGEALQEIKGTVSLNFGSIRQLQSSENEEASTFLYQAIQQQSELDLRESFSALVDNIGPGVKTLPQVLFDKDRISNLFIEHIGRQESFVSALELVKAFSKDLEKSFEPELPKFISAITNVVSTNGNIDIIKAGFSCLGYLFLNFRTYIISVYPMHLELLVPMLKSTKKGYVAVFFAECFDIIALKLWRKSSDLFISKIIELVLIPNPDTKNGIAILLDRAIHRSLTTKEKLEFIKDVVTWIPSKSAHDTPWFETLAIFLKEMKEQFMSIQELFDTTWDVIDERIRTSAKFRNLGTFTKFMDLFRGFLQDSQSILGDITDDRSMKILSLASECIACNSQTEETFTNLLCDLIDTYTYKEMKKLTIGMMKQISYEPLSLVKAAVIKNCWPFESYLTPMVERFQQLPDTSEHIDEQTQNLPCIALLVSSGIVNAWLNESQKSGSAGSFTKYSEPMHYKGLASLADSKRAFSLPEDASSHLKTCDYVNHWISTKDVDFITSEYENILKVLIVLSSVKLKTTACQHCLSECSKLSLTIISNIPNIVHSSSDANKLYSIFYYILETAAFSTCFVNNFSFLDYFLCVEKSILYNLNQVEGSSHLFSLWALKGLDNFLALARQSSKLDFVREILQITSTWDNLVSNLHSGFKIVRGISLSCLEQISQEEKEVIRLCLKLESLSTHEISYAHDSNEYFLKLEAFADRATSVRIITNFVLGYMFTNYQSVAPNCVRILKTCLLRDYKSSWTNAFEECFKFQMSSTHVSNVPTELTTEQPTDFIKQLNSIEFFMKVGDFDSENLGYEKHDNDLYRAGLWSALKGVTEKDPNLILRSAETILGSVQQKLPFHGIDRSQDAKGYRRCLTPLLDFLLTSNAVVEQNTNGEWLDRILGLLVTDSSIRGTVLKVIFHLTKDVKAYRDEFEALNNEISLSTITKFNFGEADCVVKPEHRASVSKVFVRLIYESSQTSERHKLANLRLLASCGKIACMDYVEFVFGHWTTKVANQGYTYPTRALEGQLNLITSMFTTWNYQQPEVPPVLLNILCRICRYLESPGLDIETATMETKRLIYLTKTCLLEYFESFSLSKLDSRVLEDIMTTFVWPAIHYMAARPILAPGWIFQLLKIWSQEENYRELFTQVDYQSVEQEQIIDIIFRTLKSEFNVSQRGPQLMVIILNLISGDINADTTPEVDVHASLGYKIIQKWKSEIVYLLGNEKLFMTLCKSKEHSNLCSALLPRLCELICSPELLETLSNTILGYLKLRRMDEEKMVTCFESLTKSIKVLGTEQQELVLMNVADMLIWVTEEYPRAKLFAIVESWRDHALSKLILDVNSTSQLVKKHDTYVGCQRVVETPGLPNFLFWRFLAQTLFFSLKTNSQFSDVLQAKSILKKMASKIAAEIGSSEINKPKYHSFIHDVILANIRTLIQEENAFTNVLEVLKMCIITLKEHHGTFSELSFLVYTDIIDMLYDIQIQQRTRGLNKLGLFLDCARVKGTSLSPATLKGFIEPIAMHNLFKESQSGVNINELVDSSIEMLKSLLKLVPYGYYLKFISKLLRITTKFPRILKQIERLLVAAMDAFHYDLTAAIEPVESSNLTEVCGEEEVAIEKGSRTIANVVLEKEPAKKFLNELLIEIIPTLQRCLKGAPIVGHKLSDSKQTMVEAGVLSRVAFGGALSKLISKLPPGSVTDTWDSIIPSLCSSVRSRQDTVRNVARRSLIDALKAMGISLFPKTFSYLQASLQRGYEKHVLNYTVALILSECEDQIKKLPSCVPVKGILELCSQELFGFMREEKSVTQITSQTFEARRDNARPMLVACAKFAQETSTLNLMIDIPLERYLQTAENTRAARSWLIEVCNGLLDNEYIPKEELAAWLGSKMEIYCEKLSSPLVEAITPKTRPKKSASALEMMNLKIRRVEDTTSHKHILLAEFVFQCLYDILKVTPISSDLCSAFIPYLANGIDGHSRKISVLAIRCLTCFMTYGSFSYHRNEELLNKIWQRVFVSLTSRSLGDKDDADSINATFKCMTVFLATFEDFKLLLHDFELLTSSIRTSLTNGNCSSSAMNLLKGILRQKLVSENLSQLLEHIKDLSVTSHQAHIQEGCRLVYLEYILHYNTTTAQCKERVDFFLQQLKYPVVAGRLSALDMLISVRSKVPEDIVKELTIPYFTHLLQALSTESDSDVREKIGLCMKSLFKEKGSVEITSGALVRMMSNKTIAAKDILAQVGGWLLCEGWEHITEARLIAIFKFYEDILASTESMNDKITFHTLFSLHATVESVLKRESKIMGKDTCSWNPAGRLENLTKNLLVFVRKSCFNHPHAWVQGVAMKICYCITTSMDWSKLLASLNEEVLPDPYCALFGCYQDFIDVIVSILGIYRAELNNEELGTLARNNLKKMMEMSAFMHDYQKGQCVLEKLIGDLRDLAHYEVIKTPEKCDRRLLAYELFEIMVKTCDVAAVMKFLPRFLHLTVRDFTDDNSSALLKGRTDGLHELLKWKVGEEIFQTAYVAKLEGLQQKRLGNKARKRVAAVLHPMAAKRPRKSTGKKSFKKSTPKRSN